MAYSNPVLRYFEYEHLNNASLRYVSKQFHDLAILMEEHLPTGPEKSVTLRKLLEAKDAAVRSALDLPEELLTVDRHV